MPRTGGIYNEPAGTKGTPNTTIQSAPYNGFVDDLVADANAARPVTAGGTGATNATDARTNIGANNADNLTVGTVNDARLPATMSAKTITTSLTVNHASGAATAQTVFNGASIELFWGTGAYIDFKNASGDDYDVRIQQDGANRLNITATTGLFINGNVAWHAGNDGSGSGLDADHLRGFGPTTGRTANTIVLRDASAGFQSGDITTHRGNTTGVIFLGDQTGGGRYLHYDGTQYYMPSAALVVDGAVRSGSGRLFGADGSKNMIIAPSTGSAYAGTIYLRPDGESDATGQLAVGTTALMYNGQHVVRQDSGATPWAINISGASTSIRNSGNPASTAMIFNWSGQGGQPSWLWGGNDGTNMYVWNPANFSVNYANSAGSVSGQGNLATKDDTSLVYTGTNVSNTSFPITSRLFVYTNGTAYARNATVPVYLYTLSNQAFANTGSTAVSGTWRNRGQMASDWVLAERVA